MISLCCTVLALFIMAYGFLLIVGGGPRLANTLPGALGRTLLDAIYGLLRALTRLLLAVLESVIQFVFDRPRR